MKKDLKLKNNLDEFDERFSVRDFILSEGYVSDNLPRQFANRVGNYLDMWVNYLHSLVMPNPGSMINLTEHGILDEDDKSKIIKLIDGIMELTTSSVLAGFTQTNKDKSKYLNNCMDFCDNKLSVGLIPIIKKINTNWKQKS